jgi:hypothetical protein
MLQAVIQRYTMLHHYVHQTWEARVSCFKVTARNLGGVRLGWVG